MRDEFNDHIDQQRDQIRRKVLRLIDEIDRIPNNINDDSLARYRWHLWTAFEIDMKRPKPFIP